MEQHGIQISKKTFVGSVLILLALMLAAGILTQVLPQSRYGRAVADGREVVLPDTFSYIQGDALPFWRVFTAPFEVFTSPDAVTVISIMVFIVLIGGAFLILDKSGVLRCIMYAAVRRYSNKKYKLLAALVFIFMLFGSSVGIFEELVTLVPLGVALSLSLGWDSLMGIGMTGLSVGFGFATGIFNPFTVGIAQRMSGLPAFSGLWMRCIVFAITYVLLYAFLYRYAKRIEADPSRSLTRGDDETRREKYRQTDAFAPQNANLTAAMRILASALCIVTLYILLGIFVTGLSDYSLPVMAVSFTAGGLLAGRRGRYTNSLLKDFFAGMLSIAPGLVLIMLAMSVKQIIVAGNVMDTLLHMAYTAMQGAGPYASALILYAFVLLIQFFIGSGSAKAVLIMPIVAPLASLIGLSRQSAVLAFIFGDGYTNMFFPTNPVLLIALGLAGVSYAKWFRWTWKLQLSILVVTALMLLFSVSVGYGPY